MRKAIREVDPPLGCKYACAPFVAGETYRSDLPDELPTGAARKDIFCRSCGTCHDPANCRGPPNKYGLFDGCNICGGEHISETCFFNDLTNIANQNDSGTTRLAVPAREKEKMIVESADIPLRAEALREDFIPRQDIGPLQSALGVSLEFPPPWWSPAGCELSIHSAAVSAARR
ncbi:Uu.00g085620.m01.CDS01 [Anthostomella pinea]|uniref:Uu.00g085620.m01.CDS01 n=1 Tax=Anthostomella pinea TaxID=933095 RepID=A0AAI8VMX5_9PEZI|nr:Uu.00g085620.m01.CDS01 [Anthostomella pinea]